MVAKHTFHEVQKMIAENPTIQTSNSFYRYFANTYVSHTVIGVRRQIKTDAQCISLALLLQEMTQTPNVLSRKYFVELYEGTTVEDLADSDFDRFCKPGAPHIDPDLVTADLRKLRDATARCEDFADKRVAHREKREPKALPTYNEVDACIDLLDELYVRYLLLFHAQAMDSLLPTWQYDWTEIFRVPWIRGED